MLGCNAMMAHKDYGGLELHPTNVFVGEAMRDRRCGCWNLGDEPGHRRLSAWLAAQGSGPNVVSSGTITDDKPARSPTRQSGKDGWAAGRLLVRCRSPADVISANWLVMPAQEQGADTPFGVFFARIRDASRSYMAHFGNARGQRIDRYRG